MGDGAESLSRSSQSAAVPYRFMPVASPLPSVLKHPRPTTYRPSRQSAITDYNCPVVQNFGRPPLPAIGETYVRGGGAAETLLMRDEGTDIALPVKGGGNLKHCDRVGELDGLGRTQYTPFQRQNSAVIIASKWSPTRTTA